MDNFNASNSEKVENGYSHTPDRDFRCFYPCEITLSHKAVPVCGKDKK